MRHSRYFSRVIGLMTVLILAGRSHADVETQMHRELFKAYYYDFVQRHPDAFVRHRVAIVDPDQLKRFRGAESTYVVLEDVFRAMPQVEVSIGVGAVSLSFNGDNLRALRDVAARTPLGVGLAPKETTDAEYRRYMDTHHSEVSATADAIYDVVREGRQFVTSTVFTPEQAALLREEFAANLELDPLLKSPTAHFDALLANAPASFDRMMTAIDRTKTREQLQAIRGDVDAFKNLISEKLDHVPTDAELRDLFSGVMGELQDVRSFINDQRNVQARLQRSQEMHAAVDLLGTLLGVLDPKVGPKFTTIAHQTIIAAEAVAGMTALSLTGVGTIVAAAVVIATVLSDTGPSEQEQMQAFILEIYKDIMRELADVKRGLFEIRTQLAVIDSRITDILLDSSIGFSGLQLALQSTAAQLGSLARESTRFFQVSTMKPASEAHHAIVDLMTNPAQEPNRARLLAEPAGPQGVQTQQNLAVIAQLGVIASKTAPFSDPVPLDADAISENERLEAVENRVGDLPNLATRLRAEGAVPGVGRLEGVAHPIALAQSVAWYADARNRLPQPPSPDQNFARMCDEARRAAAAAAESRTLAPFALRAVARAANDLVQVARPFVDDARLDAEFLLDGGLPPLPEETAAQIEQSLVKNGGFAAQFWVISQPGPVVRRLGTSSDRPLPDGQPAEGKEIAVLDGCAVAEHVVFDGAPRVTADDLGLRTFSGARRLVVRDRRRICASDHPIVGFPVSDFGPALERTVESLAATLPQIPFSPQENATNQAGLQRIRESLVRRRAQALAPRARDRSVITVEPPRRVDHTFVEQEPQPGRLEPIVVTRIHGCVEWVVEGKWTDETRGINPALTRDVIWTHSTRRGCLPLEGAINMIEVNELANRVRDDATAELELPSRTLAADVQRLEDVYRSVQTRRATIVREGWQSGAGDRSHPVARSIAALGLARYALDTFVRFGFNACGETPAELQAALLLVTCGGSSLCGASDAPDRRLKEPVDYPQLRAAVAEVEKMAALADIADRVSAALNNADRPVCSGGAPFGVTEAAAILNGIGRARETFLPAGCSF